MFLFAKTTQNSKNLIYIYWTIILDYAQKSFLRRFRISSHCEKSEYNKSQNKYSMKKFRMLHYRQQFSSLFHSDSFIHGSKDIFELSYL